MNDRSHNYLFKMIAYSKKADPGMADRHLEQDIFVLQISNAVCFYPFIFASGQVL